MTLGQRIVNATAAELGESGLEAVSRNRVAKQAGLPRVTLWCNHRPSVGSATLTIVRSSRFMKITAMIGGRADRPG